MSWHNTVFLGLVVAAAAAACVLTANCNDEDRDYRAVLVADLPGGNFINEMFTAIQYVSSRDDDLFVSRADGLIYRIDLNTNDVSEFVRLPHEETSAGGGYWGLLGFAFAPDYHVNGNLYVHVSDDRADASEAGPLTAIHHRTYIRRYSLTNHLSDAPILGPAFNILRWDQPGPDHNGGWIGFQPGDSRVLWITSGDGQNADPPNGDPGRDPNREGQNPATLLSTIMRIDVAGSGAGEFGNYAIPSNNPKATGDPRFVDWAPEVWSIGVRSPWGASFDRVTGDFIFGDVSSGPFGGHTPREEVNFERNGSRGGRNYGWRIWEGTYCAPAQDAGARCGDPSDPEFPFTMPLYDYTYAGGYGTAGAPEFAGRSVVGGYVYRGPIEQLYGKYIFGDWSSHQIWAFEIDRDADSGLGAVAAGLLRNLSHALGRETGPGRNPLNGPTAFGEDAAGNLYFVELGGMLFKIAP